MEYFTHISLSRGFTISQSQHPQMLHMPADENSLLSCSAGFVPCVMSQFGFDLVSTLSVRVVRDMMGEEGKECTGASCGVSQATPHMRQSVGKTMEGLLQPGHEKVPINGQQREVGLGQWSLLSLGLAAVCWSICSLLSPGLSLPSASPALAGSCSPSCGHDISKSERF